MKNKIKNFIIMILTFLLLLSIFFIFASAFNLDNGRFRSKNNINKNNTIMVFHIYDGPKISSLNNESDYKKYPQEILTFSSFYGQSIFEIIKLHGEESSKNIKPSSTNGILFTWKSFGSMGYFVENIANNTDPTNIHWYNLNSKKEAWAIYDNNFKIIPLGISSEKISNSNILFNFFIDPF